MAVSFVVLLHQENGSKQCQNNCCNIHSPPLKHDAQPIKWLDLSVSMWHHNSKRFVSKWAAAFVLESYLPQQHLDLLNSSVLPTFSWTSYQIGGFCLYTLYQHHTLNCINIQSNTFKDGSSLPKQRKPDSCSPMILFLQSLHLLCDCQLDTFQPISLLYLNERGEKSSDQIDTSMPVKLQDLKRPATALQFVNLSPLDFSVSVITFRHFPLLCANDTND